MASLPSRPHPRGRETSKPAGRPAKGAHTRRNSAARSLKGVHVFFTHQCVKTLDTCATLRGVARGKGRWIARSVSARG